MGKVRELPRHHWDADGEEVDLRLPRGKSLWQSFKDMVKMGLACLCLVGVVYSAYQNWGWIVDTSEWLQDSYNEFRKPTIKYVDVPRDVPKFELPVVWTDREIEAEIFRVSEELGLEPMLLKAIAKLESSYKQFAENFEPSYVNRVDREGCIFTKRMRAEANAWPTAKKWGASGLGIGQVQTCTGLAIARKYGFRLDSFMDFFNPAKSIHLMGLVVLDCLKTHPRTLHGLSYCYNGPKYASAPMDRRWDVKLKNVFIENMLGVM